MNRLQTISKHLSLGCLVLIILQISCSNICSDKNSNNDLNNAVWSPQGYVDLPFNQLPNTSSNEDASLNYIEPIDSDSVEMIEYREWQFYHPVSTSHRCFTFIATFHSTGDSIYLWRAEKYVRKLMSQCMIDDGAAYAPYNCRYSVHGDSANTFEIPWYSGMAQGELIEVLVRLYEFTNNKEYMDWAHMLFQSFQRLRDTHNNWTVRLDEDNYYWIEEYPHNDIPGQTLNGFIASLMGIYDYYRVTNEQNAKHIWELSLTTLKRYLPDFRRPGQTSYYCLGHKHLATEGYHYFHISQLHSLYRMTGDDFFLNMARDFEADAAVAFGATMLPSRSILTSGSRILRGGI